MGHFSVYNNVPRAQQDSLRMSNFIVESCSVAGKGSPSSGLSEKFPPGSVWRRKSVFMQKGRATLYGNFTQLTLTICNAHIQPVRDHNLTHETGLLKWTTTALIHRIHLHITPPPRPPGGGLHFVRPCSRPFGLYMVSSALWTVHGGVTPRCAYTQTHTHRNACTDIEIHTHLSSTSTMFPDRHDHQSQSFVLLSCRFVLIG